MSLSVGGILLCFLCLTTTIQSKGPVQNFVIHLEEEKEFLKSNLSDAVDIMLIHHGHEDNHEMTNICQVEQRGIDLETQEIQLIQDSDLQSEFFDPDAILKLKSFISMAHIKDGLLAVDSAMSIYMLKFDYKELHSNNKDQNITESDETRQPKFASLVWEANLLSVTEDQKSKTEISQLVYSQKNNLAFLVYTDIVQIFSITSMETDQKSLNIYGSLDWKSRKERGWSKTQGSLFYSAVGQEGLDIYQIKNQTLTYITNIASLMIEDFEIIDLQLKKDQITEEHLLVVLDKNSGISIYRITWNSENEFETSLIISGIGIQKGGIAVDSVDGKQIIAAYHQGDRYIAQEIHFDMDSLKWEVVASYEQRTKIVDVKMNKDIAVLQGVNHHQIIFFGSKANQRTYSMANPIYANHGQMRDFDFFNIEQMQSQQQLDQYNLNNGGKNNYQFDDFMFGLTKHKMFVTRYKISNAHIQCFTEDDGFFLQPFIYTAVYNISNCEVQCKREMKFSVEVVQTVMFQDKFMLSIFIVAFMILVILSLVIVITLLYCRFKHDSTYINTQMQQFQKSVDEHPSNQLQMVNSSVVAK